MGDEQLAACVALMTLRAKFDDGSGHAPSLSNGVVVMPDLVALPREVAATMLAQLAVVKPEQFLSCTAEVIDGHLAIVCEHVGEPGDVARERAFFAQMIAQDRTKYGAREMGGEVLVIDGVDRRERLEARWEDLLVFVNHYRGDAFGGSFTWPSGDEGAPSHIGAVWYAHQASRIMPVSGQRGEGP
jgi:hypothetical protein